MINLYRKLKWFIKNYKEISFGKSLYGPNELKFSKDIFHGPVTYATDSLITSNNCDFVNEPRFSKAYKRALETNPWPGFTLQWRVYIVCWLADFVKHLDGDYVECGVNTGAYSRAIIEYIDFKNIGKKFYLFDTFSGLVRSQISTQEELSGIDKYLGNYKDVYDQVKETFSLFDVEIVKGAVPGSLSLFKGNKICYLSLDMNVVEPEIAAAHFFWDKIVAGGVIVLDDYGFPQHINQKIAFDEFAREKGVQILCLPTAQGIIFKS